ncbi:MAG: hypothetical protein M5T61_03420 [Acidimicrobiia bacterium]|nr:hypothetical protein [Acidimicrobiia bacterium]
MGRLCGGGVRFCPISGDGRVGALEMGRLCGGGVQFCPISGASNKRSTFRAARA